MSLLKHAPTLGLLSLLAGCQNNAPQGQSLAPVPAAPAPPAHTSAAHGEPPNWAERVAFNRANYTKYEYRIPMRDGVRLFTSVYVPNDAGPKKQYPFLMQRTPYTVGPYGVDRYKGAFSSESFEKEGFIFVFQDVRGQHMSEGQFVDVRPHNPDKRSKTDIDESSDTYDTIEWLVKNVPYNNGRVGQKGVSYPGFYTSMGIIDSHPALKAASPQAPVADWFRGDDFHRHGAFNVQMAFAFFSGFGVARPKPTDNEEWKSFEYGTPDAYQFYLDLGPLAEVADKRFKGEVAFWKDMVAHPNYDEYWKARNILPHLKNIKAAVMVVGGWFDTEDLYGPLNTYRAIEEQNPRIKNSLVMGPWQHGGWGTPGEKLGEAEFGFQTSRLFQAYELAFFKHHLKDGPDPELPEALVFETGANRFRKLDAWPPKGVREAKLYLQKGGGLSFEAPGDGEATFDEYLSDPNKPVPYTQTLEQHWSTEYMTEDQRFASRRPDVLVYQTAPLERDVTLAGPLEAELFVSTTGTDADWVVKLIDVNPGEMPGWSERKEAAGEKNRGGQHLLVRGEPFRGRFRESYETPKPFAPGEVTPVKFAVNDVFHTFKRGHRIMIQIQSSWFPFIDRNPQTFVPSIFEAKPSDFVKATHRVYRAPATASALEVRILPSPDE
ncbi:CocE/NonD family hydrolase [Polyangium aurulentum]|uniref:CocE/NonD family hydrolase n=1 Tax=Polyangium aurulentum TaxID=2567896 RepID=UPI0010AE5F56|nr:CocE/NonD family hydrolase [Polyangium aurulentum]UQA57568.1 CocE/NonD family hydrolase [Polyangium aurulentum]